MSSKRKAEACTDALQEYALFMFEFEIQKKVLKPKEKKEAIKNFAEAREELCGDILEMYDCDDQDICQSFDEMEEILRATKLQLLKEFASAKKKLIQAKSVKSTPDLVEGGKRKKSKRG